MCFPLYICLCSPLKLNNGENIDKFTLPYQERAREGMEPINDYLAHWGAKFNVAQKSK